MLNPQPGAFANNPAQDDESLVLHLQCGNTSALVMGDSHKRTEQLLETENPQADLLKIGHHGSLTSSSPEFLRTVAPRYAVVSDFCSNPTISGYFKVEAKWTFNSVKILQIGTANACLPTPPQIRPISS